MHPRLGEASEEVLRSWVVHNDAAKAGKHIHIRSCVADAAEGVVRESCAGVSSLQIAPASPVRRRIVTLRPRT